MRRPRHPSPLLGRRSRLGFTVPEYSIAIALVAIVGGGMMAAFLFGGQICARVQPKLDATHDVRELMTDFSHQVRTAVNFDIGNGNSTNFTPVANGLPRQGNAIQIYPSADTNVFLRYYQDAASQSLQYVHTGDQITYAVALGVTNRMPFTAEDLSGNLTTNDVPKEIAGMTLQFNPTLITRSLDGTRNVKDNYQISTRICQRNSLGHQQ